MFAAGEMPPDRVTRRVVSRRLGQDAFVVVADGGLEHASSLGIEPGLIVGDFDSVSPALLAAYPPSIIERHPVAKDELDLELALAAALAAGARDVSVLGAFGDRFDQNLAAMLIAARLTRTGVRIDLHGGQHSAWPLTAGMTVVLDLPIGTTLSVIALVDDAVVRGAGLAYPLADLRVPFGTGLGVSNEVSAAGQAGAGQAGARQAGAEPAGAEPVITCVAGLVAVVAEH